MKKFLIIGSIVLVVLGGGGYFAYTKIHNNNKPNYTLVTVGKGNIIEKALAVGKIEPLKEIQIKSKIPGIVQKVYVDMGDFVKPGQVLLMINPDPTPNESAQARMDVDIAKVNYESSLKNFKRNESLFNQKLISREQLETTAREKDENKVRLDMAQERLSLLEKGRMKIANRDVENVVRSSVAGMILQRKVNEGDPVVPLTTYQAGTELLTMADMDNLIFKGTVDEIDVGKLHEGMPASIKIGALPNARVPGVIRKIAPKAKLEQSATLFDIEINIQRSDSVLLRAGYSSNAEIVIQKKDSVLVIPERLVTFKDDSVYVEVETAPNIAGKRMVKVGISDGLNVEIDSGLTVGEKVIERPPKKIDTMF